MAAMSAVWWRRLELVVVGLLSLGVISAVNRAWYLAVFRIVPAWDWTADACIASLAVCFAIYLAVRPRRPFAMPQPGTPWARMLRISAVWLAVWIAGSALFALKVGHWIKYAHGPAAIAGFVILGPLQEELLFRGAIFVLVERAFPHARVALPILVSSLLFSLHHFELHHYTATGAALLQVGFTFPMGLVFGSLRAQSGSIWPGLGLHVLTNLPGCFGS